MDKYIYMHCGILYAMPIKRTLMFYTEVNTYCMPSDCIRTIICWLWRQSLYEIMLIWIVASCMPNQCKKTFVVSWDNKDMDKNADMDCGFLYAKSMFVDGPPYAACVHHHYMGNKLPNMLKWLWCFVCQANAKWPSYMLLVDTISIEAKFLTWFIASCMPSGCNRTTICCLLRPSLTWSQT